LRLRCAGERIKHYLMPFLYACGGWFHLFASYDVHVLGVKHDEVASPCTASA
jgi:hypothetical protein